MRPHVIQNLHPLLMSAKHQHNDKNCVIGVFLYLDGDECSEQRPVQDDLRVWRHLHLYMESVGGELWGVCGHPAVCGWRGGGGVARLSVVVHRGVFWRTQSRQHGLLHLRHWRHKSHKHDVKQLSEDFQSRGFKNEQQRTEAYATVWAARRPSGDKWGARCSRWWAGSWEHSSSPPSRLWWRKQKHTQYSHNAAEFIIISMDFTQHHLLYEAFIQGQTAERRQETEPGFCSTECSGPGRTPSKPPGGFRPSGSLTVLHQYRIWAIYYIWSECGVIMYRVHEACATQRAKGSPACLWTFPDF